MVGIESIVEYCEQRLQSSEIVDFPGARNGLQLGNRGSVSKIGAAVDAGLLPFQQAVERGIDFLIVHHGMYWNPPFPIVGAAYKKLSLAIENNLAVYGAHLPLDMHPEIGNNAILLKKLELELVDWVFPFEGRPVAALTKVDVSRDALQQRIAKIFPKNMIPILYGSEVPKRAVILTGSGSSVIPQLASVGADTFITGELKQDNFNLAQELNLNIFACGHYASEVFGVRALAEEIGNCFNLPWEFVATECPL